MKKVLVALVLGTVIVSSVVGCGGGSPTKAAPTK
jgi:hypothetical protein